MSQTNCAAAGLGLLVALAASPALADGSIWESLAKSTGLTTTPPEPPDFVKATRPTSEPTSIPAFAAPDEPRSKVKTPGELKAMDADLEKVGRAQRARLGAADPNNSNAAGPRGARSKNKAAKSPAAANEM